MPELPEVETVRQTLRVQLLGKEIADVKVLYDRIIVSDKEEFKTLAENHAEFTVEEIKSKLDAIILDYAKKGSLNFSAETETNKIGKTRLPIQTNKNKKSRYGSIFSK